MLYCQALGGPFDETAATGVVDPTAAPHLQLLKQQPHVIKGIHVPAKALGLLLQ